MTKRAPAFGRDTPRVFKSKLNTLSDQVNKSVQISSSVLKSPARMTYQALLVEVVVINNANQYLECRDFASAAGATFPVLLPPVFTQTSRGAISFVYSDLNTRTATESAVVETQEITPVFIVGEILQAAYMSSIDAYMFISDGRMWAKTG